ncbi:hypothetical protein V8C42DRAFT_307004 [Trichoderma barbatum]
MVCPRHSPPARSTVYHQDQCSQSVTLPSVSQSKCTCSRTDFIPSWLQHVQTSYNDTSPEAVRQASPDPKETSWHPNDIPTVRIQSRYGPGRYQSSDLFIQDSPSPSPLAGQTCRHRHHESALNSDHGKDLDDRKGHYRSKTHVSTPSGASLVERDVFEKRPRRKTRKDRYTAVKSKDVGARKHQTKRSSTRVSKSGRLRSSRDIMANFKSSAITNPNERITLKPSFTPGLFVNGRSSAPVTDLVFNDIPSPDEGNKPNDNENERSSKPTTREAKGDINGQNEIEFLANALRRLKEAYPPPGSSNMHNSGATSIISTSDFHSVQRSTTIDAIDHDTAAGSSNTMLCHEDSGSGSAQYSAGCNNMPSPQHDSHEFHSRPVRSLSPTTAPPFSSLDMLNKSLPLNSNSSQEARSLSTTDKRGQQELKIGMNSDECRLGSGNPAKSAKYEDKGVMVSPWMHHLIEKHKSHDKVGDNHQFWPNEAKSYGCPTDLPHVSERLNLRTEIKDIHNPHSDSSSAWFFARPSAHYALHPFSKSGLSFISGFESSINLSTQSKDLLNIDIPAQLANSDPSYQLSREVHQDSGVLESNALHTIDDIPGESLREYIERMEREILGPDKPITPFIDDDFHSAQDMCKSQIPGMSHADAFNNTRYSDHHLHRAESKDHISSRDAVRPIREELCLPPPHHQRLPYPGESLSREIESELASFWRPNRMMWC